MNEEFESVTPVGAPLAEFGADFTREEYIAFYTARQKKPLSLIPLIPLIFIAISVINGVEYGFIPLDFVEIGCSVLVGLYYLLVIPAMRRRRVGLAYDQTCEDYDYYGTVRVFSDRIEKECCGQTVTMYYDSSLYIEEADWMVFQPVQQKPGARALILTSRVLTAADAEVIRGAAMNSILPNRRMLRHRLVTKATERLPLPVPKETQEQVLCEVTGQYTEKDYLREMRHGADRNYARNLPLYMPLILLLAVMEVTMAENLPVILLLIASLLFLGWLAMRLRFRSFARRIIAVNWETFCEVHLTFTTRGVRYHVGDMEQTLFITWPSMAHAVESATMMTFTSRNKYGYIALPKNGLTETQLETVRNTVNAYIHKAQ